MGYERNDRPYGRDNYGRNDRGYGRDRFGRDDNSGGRRDYGRAPQGYDYDDRGFFDRAGDEVRSWFGDDDAERRRELDERYREREYGDRYSADRSREGGYGSRGGDRDENYATRARRYGGGLGSSYGSSAGAGGAGYGQTNDAGDYGAGRGAGATGSWGLGAGNDRQTWGQDPSYQSWRDRQMADLDRDYEDYRREHQSKFDSEFGNWRTSRQTQRQSLGRVQEHQEVVGSDGAHVGTVDKVRGDRIILTKTDQDAGGHHHSIPCNWIHSVDEKVTISKTASEAQSHWRDEERSPALGGRDDRDGSDGPHALNRSFSGTYR